MIFNWKAIIFGFIIAVVLALALGTFYGSLGSTIGVFIACVIAGYMVNRDLWISVKHGALIGLIGGVILIMLVIIAALSVGGSLRAFTTLDGIFAIIGSLATWIIIGAVGGGIGSTIREELNQKQTTEEL